MTIFQLQMFYTETLGFLQLISVRQSRNITMH